MPSPIRRFNDNELRQSQNYCSDSRVLQIHSALQRVPPLDSSLNLAPTKTLVGGRVQLLREHDDELSPFQTPRSGDHSFSPVIRKCQGADENVLESSTNSKQGKVEQRFAMPSLRFNLISSIGDFVNLPDTMSRESQESQRYLVDSAVHQQSSKCLSPLKKSILGCCEVPYTRTKAVKQTSRNQRQSNLASRVTSTLRSIEECNDVNEYLDESRHSHSLTKRLNINSCVMSPGGRVTTSGNIWSQHPGANPADTNPEEEDLVPPESNHYCQVVNALKIIQRCLQEPPAISTEPVILPPPNASHSNFAQTITLPCREENDHLRLG